MRGGAVPLLCGVVGFFDDKFSEALGKMVERIQKSNLCFHADEMDTLIIKCALRRKKKEGRVGFSGLRRAGKWKNDFAGIDDRRREYWCLHHLALVAFYRNIIDPCLD